MGMDVSGLNPKQNKNLDDFPVMDRFDSMDFKEKWKALDKDKALRDEYWREKDKWETSNPGVYFRNNVWWWRPLWNYCYAVADDIIEGNLQIKEYETDDDGEMDYENYRLVKAKHDDGHGNSGAGLNDKYAKLLGNRLMECIANGSTIKYQANYEQYLNDIPDDDCWKCKNNNRGNDKKKECKSCNKTGKQANFSKSYSFDVDNVEAFAKFCIESGGFEIC
mgnify:CR=1 FL=1